MNTTLKHIAFNLAAAAVVLIAADIAFSHALASIGLFTAFGLVTLMVRDYGHTPRQLPLASTARAVAPRNFATHRLAA